jgi:predicted RNA-binding Zn ribbon-like protein
MYFTGLQPLSYINHMLTAQPSEAKEPPPLPFRWLGGRRELDFANTVAWFAETEGSYRERGEYERLTSYGRLVEWAIHAGLVTISDARDLVAVAETRPREAALVLNRAVILRRSIHALFTDAFHNRPTHPGHLEAFNKELQVATRHLRIAVSGGGFDWDWVRAEASLDRVLWPIVWAASHFLTSRDSGRVRECAGVACGFLFFDSSRGGRRRWCVMSHCGNRVKVRRHYQRQRQAAQKSTM